jgi:hypothetical protein
MAGKKASKAGRAKRSAAPRAARRSPAKGQRGRSEGPSTRQLESILNEISANGQAEAKQLETWANVQCPYCGEAFEVHIEAAEDGQTMYEDCHVCCKPISLHVQVEDGDVHVSAYRS